MKWAVVLVALLALSACSAAGSFEPAECPSLSPDDQGIMHDQLYRDLLRGTYGSDDCFEFRGDVTQSIEGGYLVDTESLGSNYTSDVFVRWEGDYRFVEGDWVVITGAAAGSLTFETVLGVERTIPAFHGSDMITMEQYNTQISATRQVIHATKQVEYVADYEQRTVEAFQEVQSCRDPIDITSYIQNSYNGYLTDLNLNFSIGPVPDSFSANTVPNILTEGYYTITPVYRGDDIQYGQVTARWSGKDCEFEGIQLHRGMRPTPDPDAPQPTYTPRPAPSNR